MNERATESTDSDFERFVGIRITTPYESETRRESGVFPDCFQG